MTDKLMLQSCAFMIESPLKWAYYPNGLEVSFFIPGPFGHWSLALRIKEPATLLDLLSRVQDDDDVCCGEFEVYIEDSHVCIINGHLGVAIDLMDLGKLTGWLEEAIGGANHDSGK